MQDCAWEKRYTPTQLSRWNQAISLRYSCRGFSGDADMDSKSALHYMAERAKLPGVRVVFASGDAGRLYFPIPFVDRIENTTQYAAIVYASEHPGALLHAGIVGEALVLEATALGLGTCWVAGNYRRQRVDVKLKRDEKIAALIPFGAARAQDGAAHRRRKPLKDLCLGDPALWPNWAFQAAEAVRGAPSAMNGQPWRFSFAGSTLQMSGRGFPNVNFGIAVLHMLCALPETTYRWRFNADGSGLLVNPAEA